MFSFVVCFFLFIFGIHKVFDGSKVKPNLIGELLLYQTFFSYDCGITKSYNCHNDSLY